MVNKTTNFKKQGKPQKGNLKKGGKKAAAPPEKPKGGPKPDTDCYYCNGKGHWKRNCPKYLANDLKSGLVKKKKGISDIHVIDVYLTGSRTSAWGERNESRGYEFTSATGNWNTVLDDRETTLQPFDLPPPGVGRYLQVGEAVGRRRASPKSGFLTTSTLRASASYSAVASSLRSGRREEGRWHEILGCINGGNTEEVVDGPCQDAVARWDLKRRLRERRRWEGRGTSLGL
ncbi:hypothetical protein QYE76_021159 [Lolium multiflorum]|uniref:CCHC-type domain-containing protein n=1 Tax=Lolium multiflorum TaxID=4521 RepID=A0AAD8R8H0_LOLMU|nr:hypothetical protein QYE76_021159 [Lolium multiflorum]